MENNSLRESFLRTKDPIETKYLKFIDWEFDYELSNLSHDKLEKIYSNSDNMNLDLNFIKESSDSSVSEENKNRNENNKSSIIGLDEFFDELAPRFYKCDAVFCMRKKFIKSLISKKKIRLINKDYDLDLIYITKKVMAMGFPAVGCESLIRNSLSDVRRFLENEHNNNVKIYNLCLETDKLYTKERFPECEMALFPFSDHQACPVRLMLEFCVDLVMFLSKEKDNVAAVHCKAGKGRTGIMICCYLIFTGISDNTLRAFQDYAERRSHKRKGVTIPSQKRYIHHFETYLSCNFEKPYIKMIPKICRYYLKPYKNILVNIFKDKEFRDFKNSFKILKIKIGPFVEKHYLNIVIEDFKKRIKFDSKNKYEKINFKYAIKEETINNKTLNYSIFEFNEPFIIDQDINVKIISNKICFNSWLNFFYITLEYYFFMIDEFLNNQMISNAPYCDKRNNMINLMQQNNVFSRMQSNIITNNMTTNKENNKMKTEMSDLSNKRSSVFLGNGMNFLNNHKTNYFGNIATSIDISGDLTRSGLVEKNSHFNNNQKMQRDQNVNHLCMNIQNHQNNTIDDKDKYLVNDKDLILQNKKSDPLVTSRNFKNDKTKLQEIEDKLNKIYSITYDSNYYWKNDIVFNGDKIKTFLKENTNFIDENIQMFDLNNIYKFFFEIHSEYFENQKKKFKIKFDASGLDKFSKKKKMLNDFRMEIKYSLC